MSIYLNMIYTKYFQSAYKVYHSSETALIWVHNDILQSLGNKQSLILGFLVLSAAFDTVNHDILLCRLAARFGKTGNCYMNGRCRISKVCVYSLVALNATMYKSCRATSWSWSDVRAYWSFVANYFLPSSCAICAHIFISKFFLYWGLKGVEFSSKRAN